MKPTHRTIDQLIEEQAHKWQAMQEEKKKGKPAEPTIAISRLTGSRGAQVAKRVAEDLGFDLFGREIIQKVAESAHLSAAVVATLDEKGRTTLEDWLHSGVSKRTLWSDQYLQHLAKVIGTAARHGRAVIFGRGGSFLLPPKESLRVLIVAPAELRAERIAADLKIPIEKARQTVDEQDADRKAYIKKYFHAEFLDPLHYDLVINTGDLALDAAVELVKAAWKSKKAG